jgi:prophage antirepressor-like protein
MTPQTQLTLSKVFDEKNIRAMEMDGEVWVPVVDIAEAWGVDRSTLTKIINRNPEIFNHLSTVIDLTSPNQISPNSETVNNSLRLVNERGMTILGLKVSAGHIKNKVVKDKIIDFQLWVPGLIQDLRKGLITLSTPTPTLTLHQARMPVDILKEELDVADELVSRSGLTKEQAHSYAVILAGERAGVNLQCYATAIKAQSTQLQLIEAEPIDREEFNKLHSLRDLSGMLKLPENKVRTVLESIGVIYFEHGIWKLTKRGEQYGKAFLVTIGYPYRTNQKAWIRYNELCIDLLKKYFDVQMPVKVE